MTSWPWMKGINIAVADPIPPVNDKDDRPSVKDLIQDHRKDIDAVRAELTQDPLYDANMHDDLWIVRFLLSQKRVKLAIKAAKHTLVFRKERKFDRDVRFYPAGTRHNSSNLDIAESSCRYLSHVGDDFIRFGVPDAQRGVIEILSFGSLDQNALVKNVAESDWVPVFAFSHEWVHQWADYITRTTGRLTKMVRIVNLDGFSFSMFNHECNLRDGRALNSMEDCYPQLLQGMFICNSPVWLQIPWRILRPIIPKRVVQKMDFVSPNKNPKELKKICKYIDEEYLPTRLGGKNETWPFEVPLPKTD